MGMGKEPLPASKGSTATLIFQLGTARSNPGETVAVVGSCYELGDWQPEQAVALLTDEQCYPCWRSEKVVLTCQPEESCKLTFKYKYVLSQGAEKVLSWEDSIADRQVSIPLADLEHGSVWLVRDEAFDVACPTVLTRLAPKDVESKLLIVPEETPEVEEVAAAPLFDAQYSLVGRSPIAKGGFSSVWRCRRRSGGLPGKEFAVKRVDTSQLPQRGRRFLFGQGAFAGEIKLHQLLHHPNVVSLVEVFHDACSDMVSLVMEYCRGGDLLEIVLQERAVIGKGLGEPAARSVSRQLFQALAFLHGQGVVHRDVKCENIFRLEANSEASLEAATFKLGDFGLAACVMPEEVLIEQVGSPSTSAPEVVHGRPYGKLADVWSAGAAIFTVLAARRPFEASSYSQMLRAFGKAQVTFNGESWDHVSEAAKTLVSELMQHDPRKRPSADEALQHPWISGEA
eukprot:gb/GFBE01063028.1/.p1 GENE.gb/GFBE01063028.1/~~gb/GFBE01063028.1/.p1  ORF type:complete len:455 (+),score=98.92 gb/GFBE01063028.1/:1-1365(+)